MFNKYIDGYDKRLMKKNDFKYSKKFNKFILDGYGAYLKDVSNIVLDNYINILGKLGYEIVSGPHVESDDVSFVGIYCKNYLDVFCSKEEFNVDVDTLKNKIITVSSLEKTTLPDVYLKNFVYLESSFLIDVASNLELVDLYKIVEDLKIVSAHIEEDKFTLKEVVSCLSRRLYNRIICDLDKDVDKDKVSLLVAEAKSLAVRSRHIAIASRQMKSGSLVREMEDCVRKVFNFVDMVKNESTTGEIRYLLREVKEDEFKVFDACKRKFAELNDCVEEKSVIDEYFDKGKVKKRSSFNRI